MIYLQLEKKIIESKEGFKILNAYSSKFINKNLKVGVVELVKYDINHSLERYNFHFDRFIYHAENFIKGIRDINITEKPIAEGSHLAIEIKPSVYFEFDSFLATVSSLFEEPFKQDAQVVFNKKIMRKFELFFPNKKEENSLLWRLTIMRNRVVHPDNATYNQNGSRYMEFSSKGGLSYQTKGNKIVIPSTLIDIKYNKELRNFLKKEIIEPSEELKRKYRQAKKKGENPCRPNLPDFHQVFFNKGKRPKKEKSLLYVNGANLFDSFESILTEVLLYVNKLNDLYIEQYEELLR